MRVFPANRWSVLLIGLLWFVPGPAMADDEALRKEALKLNDIFGEEPMKERIEALKKKPEHAKKLVAVAVTMAKEAEQPFNYTGALVLGKVSGDLKDVEAGQLFLRICIDKAEKLKSDGKLADAYLELIRLYSNNKKYAEAEKVCKEVLGRRGSDAIRRVQEMAFERLMRILALQGKEEEAFKLLDRLLKADPDNLGVMDTHAYLMRHFGKYEEAEKTYKAMLDKAGTEQELKDIILYQLGNLYADMREPDKANEVLSELLKRHPDNPTYNNDLGYILADHDRRLDDAEKMVKKALEKDPKSAAYLDSLGWVYFKQKKYKEAKEYLLQSVQDEEGQHSEILDHLGEVHKALGEKAEALAVWKKAVEVSGTSKREQVRKEEIEKKIKENQ